jgi:HEAT repeat protein
MAAAVFVLFLILSSDARAWPVPSIGKDAIPEDMPPRIRELVEQLYVDETCTAAANSLGDLGPAAVSAAPFLASVLHGHYSLGTPNAATKALVKLGEGAFDATAIGATARSGDAKRRAFHVLTTLNPERAAPVVFDTFGPGPASVRDIAFLRKCGEPARKLAQEALKSDDPVLRRRAVRAMPAFSSLPAGYRDFSGIETEYGVRNPDFHTQPTIDLLMAATADPDRTVRQAALESLLLMNGCPDKRIPLSDTIRAALADKDPAIRIAAVDVVVRADEPEKVRIETLAPLATDRDPDVRAKLASILAKLAASHGRTSPPRQERESLLPLLMTLLKDLNQDTRRKAAEGLGDLQAVEAMDQLIAMLGDPGLDAPSAAAEALGKIGGSKAAAALIAAAAKPQDKQAYLVTVESLSAIYARHWQSAAAQNAADRSHNVLDGTLLTGITNVMSAALRTQDRLCHLPAIKAFAGIPTTNGVDIVPYLILGMSSPEGSARETAETTILRDGIKDPRLIEHILKTIVEDDGQKAAVGFRVLQRDKDSRSIPILAKFAKRATWDGASGAIGVLADMGEDGLKAVADCLDRGDWPLDRNPAIGAMATRMQNPKVQALVDAAMRSTNATVRAHALRILTVMPENLKPPSRQLHNAILAGDDACKKCISRPETNWVATATSLLREDTDTTVRVAAARILCATNDSSTPRALAGALADPSAQVRAQAAESLGLLGDRTVVPAIILALRDPEPGVRTAAADALDRLDDGSAIAALIEAMSDQDWTLRCAAARGLGGLSDGKAAAALKKALERDPHWRVRAAAASSLGLDPKIAPEPALIAALTDNHWLVRRSAHESLRSLTKQDIPANAEAWQTWWRNR